MPGDKSKIVVSVIKTITIDVINFASLLAAHNNLMEVLSCFVIAWASIVIVKIPFQRRNFAQMPLIKCRNSYHISLSVSDKQCANPIFAAYIIHKYKREQTAL